MILKPIDQITETDLRMLIDNMEPESKTLEYKREPPGRDAKAQHDFRADISAMANASGGIVFYGIDEKDGLPIKISGTEKSMADAEMLRLRSMLSSGIDRPIYGIEIRPIPTPQDGTVIAAYIPKSFSAPHMVTVAGVSKFFVRHGNGQHQMNVDEIRNAFLATDSQAERIKHFREDRLAKILADETPVKLSSPYRTVLHLIPLGNFQNKSQIDLKHAHGCWSSLLPFHSAGGDVRFNLDGFLTFSDAGKPPGTCNAYCQVFRDGSIESVSASLLAPLDGQRLQHLPAPIFLSSLLEWMNRCLVTFKSLSIAGPAVLMASLMGVKGMRILLRADYPFLGAAADRDHLFIPEILVENCQAQPASTLRPIMDTLFNAFGYRECPNYSEDGRFA